MMFLLAAVQRWHVYVVLSNLSFGLFATSQMSLLIFCFTLYLRISQHKKGVTLRTTVA